MIKAVSETVEAFNNRSLHNRYVCVYLDATYIAVQRDTVSKEAIYIAIGIREDGSKKVLAIRLLQQNRLTTLLQELKERGVEDVLLFISDGLKGMADAVFNMFPKAKYQARLVHVARNIMHKVCEDFKMIHQAKDADAAKVALDTFCAKWGKSYRKVTQGLLAPLFTDVLSVSKSDLAKHRLNQFNRVV